MTGARPVNTPAAACSAIIRRTLARALRDERLDSRRSFPRRRDRAAALAVGRSMGYATRIYTVVALVASAPLLVTGMVVPYVPLRVALLGAAFTVYAAPVASYLVVTAWLIGWAVTGRAPDRFTDARLDRLIRRGGVVAAWLALAVGIGGAVVAVNN